MCFAPPCFNYIRSEDMGSRVIVWHAFHQDTRDEAAFEELWCTLKIRSGGVEGGELPVLVPRYI